MPRRWLCAICGKPASLEAWPTPCEGCGNYAIVTEKAEEHRFDMDEQYERFARFAHELPFLSTAAVSGEPR